jgi:hypothetical protein
MERSCWIGGDKFNHDALAGTQVSLAVVTVCVTYLVDHLKQGLPGQVEIYKSGTGDFRFFNVDGFRDTVNNFMRQVPGIALCLFSEPQGDIAGEITVGSIPGTLHREQLTGIFTQRALLLQLFHSARKKIVDKFFHFVREPEKLDNVCAQAR